MIKIKPRDNGTSGEGSLRALWEGKKDSAVFWRCGEEVVAAADQSGGSLFHSWNISKHTHTNPTLRDAAYCIAKKIWSSYINHSLFYTPISSTLFFFFRSPVQLILFAHVDAGNGSRLSWQTEWYGASSFKVGFTKLSMSVWQLSLLTAKEELKVLTIWRVFGEWKPKQKTVKMRHLRIGLQVKADCP